MNVLLVGPAQDNSTDGVIIRGIRYLLRRNYDINRLDYIELKDTTDQETNDFNILTSYDLIVVCGTPWLWDSFQKSIKFTNLVKCFDVHKESKRLFMGIGSCLYLKDIDSNLLEREDEVAAMHKLYDNATVIVRDSLAYDKLRKAGVKSTLLPCPAYLCYGDEPIIDQSLKVKNVLVFQDPTESISAGDWTDETKLKEYYDKVMSFYSLFQPEVYCANSIDIPKAIEIGLPEPKLLKTSLDTINLMRLAKKVLSCRVHCAVPAIAQGAQVALLELDTRGKVVTEFRQTNYYNRTSFLPAYDQILQDIFYRKVGTESQRTYEELQKNGFFSKYMSGKGLDIGYAGYTDGVKPILDTATGVDTDYPGYDGKTLPFEDESQDYVYSSHCLEHISDYTTALKEWYRVLKTGGHLVLTVPHQHLYEKKQWLPSLWNEDHKRFYTPCSLLGEVEAVLEPNSYRIRLLEDGDREFNYDLGPGKHSSGQYEILLVIQKIKKPSWKLKSW